MNIEGFTYYIFKAKAGSVEYNCNLSFCKAIPGTITRAKNLFPDGHGH